ncbi:MAG: PIG-L family deacetylase [Pirellulaceae bacterium]|nr:PIG-L family deacetylase [Planctomycetales bacterium]MCA9162326.1 PIG-L family deacetylase [Planctomycetales bacterium]MCA9209501.1 PIG-L family deacetylase [Planctomycetales bacterium]
MSYKSALLWLGVVSVFAFGVGILDTTVSAEESRPLRIIGFGAHPDDNEIRIGGTAILWAKQGHKVKFVSVTNGDIGHHKMAGGPLAQRRAEEARRSAKVMGIETEVLDIHDGELEPTLENRRKITRLIREWEADLVFCHRPWDYHPDHRYTGVLVQDAAFMVTIPYFCPDTPALKNNPVFMYYSDRFQKPYPFQPDVIVAIDSVMEQKLLALEQLESQFLDWWQRDNPIDVNDTKQRKDTINRLFLPRFAQPAKEYRELLVEYYGEAGKDVQYAEAFELCEYGRQPKRDELKKLFPINAE